jgi:hydroxymethylbilane synthase
MPDNIYRIGSRGSKLSQIQTNFIIDLLKQAHPQIKIESVIIKTTGDIDTSTSLERLGGSGAFTKQIEESLLGGKIDIAIHSAKDLPSKMSDGLAIAAVPPRGPCQDAWLSNEGVSFMQIRPGSKIGTSSPRRRAMLLNMRKDLVISDLRGNVETRIKKLRHGDYDGIILALAGLTRLGLQNAPTAVFSSETFIPSPGQGALAVQIRADDTRLAQIMSKINHEESHRCLNVERGLLRRFDAGCDIAFACWARYIENGIRFSAAVLDKNGERRVDADNVVAFDRPDGELIKNVFAQLSRLGALELI